MPVGQCEVLVDCWKYVVTSCVNINVESVKEKYLCGAAERTKKAENLEELQRKSGWRAKLASAVKISKYLVKTRGQPEGRIISVAGGVEERK